MDIWNIHAALNFAFLFQQGIIQKSFNELFLSLGSVWKSKHYKWWKFLQDKCKHLQSLSKRAYGLLKCYNS